MQNVVIQTIGNEYDSCLFHTFQYNIAININIMNLTAEKGMG
jgi:hypothetical protein